MSILIKGMEMPKSCWRCPLCLIVDPDTYRCIPTGQDFESTFDAIDHIVLSCPLVEVPPHGRLIDADAMLLEAKQISGPITGDGWDNYGVYALIERQPTIIDAEVDNEHID